MKNETGNVEGKKKSGVIDAEALDREHKLEAQERGELPTLLEKAKANKIIHANKSFLAHLEGSNPNLAKFGRQNFSLSINSRASYTEEEKEYFMKKNYDWFVVEGSCYHDAGKPLDGISGSPYLPCDGKYGVCTIERFVELVTRGGGDANWGRHKHSFEDDSLKYERGPYWKGRKITKYNIDKFVIDYCEGKVARMEGVGTLPKAEMDTLVETIKTNRAKK